MLTKLTAVIISRYICKSNHYAVHLNLTECHMSIISIKLEKKFFCVYACKNLVVCVSRTEVYKEPPDNVNYGEDQ